MKVRRATIPTRLEDELLFRADHTCCICRSRGKDVQIHHIDSDSTNNDTDNLSLLCLDCHSRVTGGRGLGRRYTQGEVRKYKRSWEHQILESRRIHRPPTRRPSDLLTQIDLTVCEILACSRNPTRAGELLDVLYEMHLWRGNRMLDRKIIEGLHHLSLMTGLGSPRLAEIVAEKLWQMCWHYVGPHEVPMTGGEMRVVLECVEALDTLADFNCSFGHGRRAIDTIGAQLENFFEVGVWYSKQRISLAVVKAYQAALNSCYDDKRRVQFQYGRTSLRRSLRKTRRILSEAKPRWTGVKRRIARALDL